MKCRKGDLPPPNDEDQPAPKALLRLFRHSGHAGTTEKKGTMDEQQKLASKKGRRKKSRLGGTDRLNSSESCPDHADSDNHPSLNQPVIKGSTGGGPGMTSDPPPTGRAAMFVRRPGESTRDYLERIDIESKSRIVDSLRKQKEKSTKRKRFGLHQTHHHCC